MKNKVASHFATDQGGVTLKVETRAAFQQLTPQIRDVTTGALVSSTAGVPSANLLSSLDNEVVAVAGSVPYVLAENEIAWSKFPYVYSPTIVKQKPVYTKNSQTAAHDGAAIGGVFFRTWSEPAEVLGSPGFVRGFVVDSDGTPIRAPWKIVSGDSATRAKVVADGARFWVVFSIGTTVHVQCYDTHGVIIAEKDFETLSHKANPWDLIFTSGTVLYAQANDSTGETVRVTKLTIASRTITSTTTDMSFVAIGNHGIAWAENASGDGNAYLLTSHIDPDGGTVEYAYRIGTLSTTPTVTATMNGGQYYDQDGEGGYTGILCEMTGIFRDGTLYTQLSFFDASDIRLSRTVFATMTASAASKSVKPTVRSVQVASRVFRHDGRDVVLAYYPQAATEVIVNPADGQPHAYGGEPTYFLLDILTRQCCGRFNAGNAAMEWTRTGYPAAGIGYSQGPFLFCVPHVFIDTNAAITHVPCGYESATYNRTELTGSDILRTYLKVVAAVGYQDLEFGGLGQAIEFGGELLMPGAIATSFNGVSFSENSLNLSPAQPSAAQDDDPSGHLTAHGHYEYVVVFQRVLRNGDRVLSSTSIPVVCVLSGSNNRITLTGYNLHMTTCDDVTIAIYRNVMNAGVPSQIHYRVDDPLNPLLNDPTAKTWTFVDTTDDSDLLSHETLYTDLGLLQREPMPSFSCGTVFDGRVVCVGPDNAIWYSAQKVEGDATWFALSQRIPAFTNEPIKSLVAMDSRLVVICEKSIWLQDAGGFPGPTGEGGNIQAAVKQVFTNGGTGHAHLIAAGVAYASSEGGLWLLNRGGTNEQMSSPVVDDMTDYVISGIVVDDAQRMHVGLTGGPTDGFPGSVVYDQLNGTWSRFETPTPQLTLHTIRGKAAFGDDACVMVQNPDASVDHDGTGAPVYITDSIEFEPLHFAGIKKFVRCWRMMIQGETEGNCTVTLTATYDPKTAQTPIMETWTWAVSSTDVFNFEFQPAFEQFQDVAFKIETSFPVTDPVTAYTGRSFTLEALGFEVALESGLPRIPLRQRVQSSG